MTYLLAKYTLLFLLTAVLGFVLGYWWSRRRMVDVSESYEDLRRAAQKTDATNWEQLWSRFDAIPSPKEPDLSSVFEQLDGVRSAVAGIPQPDKVDLAPLERQLGSLADQIASIPKPEKPRDPDLRPLAEHIDKLEKAIRAIPAPADIAPIGKRLDEVRGAVAAIPQPEKVDTAPLERQLGSLADRIASMPKPEKPRDPDLSPLAKRIDKLEHTVRSMPAPADVAPFTDRIKGLETAVRNIPAPPPGVDLQPVHKALSSIRDQITSLPKVETHEPVNLAPVLRQIDALEKRMSAMPKPEKVDLQPIDTRLRSVETQISKLGKRLAGSPPAARKVQRSAKPSVKSSKGPKILKGAVYGRKDDLKRISGVGPKLERLLNNNGVYYFWQVASWSGEDIRTMDRRLEVFKGRISRDDWVTQAKKLIQSPDAAPVPAEQV